MDANFINIRIISYRDKDYFQFVPLVQHMTEVAYYTKYSPLYDIDNI